MEALTSLGLVLATYLALTLTQIAVHKWKR